MHLITRGVGKQLIFETGSDYRFFLKMLEKFSGETDVKILAYCLMSNHVHLLVFDAFGNTSSMMRKLETTYAAHFNEKYERVGHLFQNRFLNENIANERQLLTVFRYILNNPEKAGICKASSYAWSSYACCDNPDSFVDTSLLLDLIGGRNAFREFMSEENNDVCLEPSDYRRNDQWAKQKLPQILHVESGTFIQQLSRRERDAALRELKENGLSLRQIERLTGISKSVVQRA